MSVRTILFLLVLAVIFLVGLLVAAVALLLGHVRGLHPALSIAAAAGAFAATVSLEIGVAALGYTVLF
ncbi:hypothetical protein [Paractinoplanes globisporus]|uniref:NADH dehydrogenase subunit 6 n=1 Tax=Paractinoplanes globisporus TaxID=113565 RepID=A0ABW6WP80_9ACTN|nr:hypothetical protein [Actinoplanes globisporus]